MPEAILSLRWYDHQEAGDEWCERPLQHFVSSQRRESQKLTRSQPAAEPSAPAPSRPYDAYSSMSSSSATMPRIYESYSDSTSSSTAPTAVIEPTASVRNRSRSPATRVHFSETLNTSYGAASLRRTNLNDPPKIQQLFMSATFTQDVEDKEWVTVSTAPKIETSLKVGGVDWVFKVQKRAIEGTPHVGFTLVCGSKLKSALWRIAANVKLIIKKKNGTEKSLANVPRHMFLERPWLVCLLKESMTLHHEYPNNEFTFASKTLADMIPWDEIDTTLSCSNKEDSKSPVTLSFELQIDITKSYGFRRRARFEYSFFEPSYETDMILMVENRELYVNATYLAMLSPFFRSLLSKNMSLYGEIPTETINDVSLEDFLELLHVVYPSEKRVTVENVELLLKLGDRYNFESVLVKCEDFLVTPKADDIDVFTRLEWASKYAMADLQDHCVSKLNSAQDIGAVKKTLLYGSLSHETRKLLLELMLKFSNM
ncbi:BTB/POZ domain protein [Ancylostoma ceylanicum]|uniref:BTB/POZ domain protein n=1 Tax=Ancylostoma ceylanicum TaxID=53326 RepID=A0A0D6LLP8_9BILA|nr:BTB/POZ domain protein [Ancylostoma ceylanicum]